MTETLPPPGDDEERKPLFVHCRHCRHEFIAVWLPMEISQVAGVLSGQRCPACASKLLSIGLRRTQQRFRDVRVLLEARRESAHQELAELGLVDLGFGVVCRTEAVKEVRANDEVPDAVFVVLGEPGVSLLAPSKDERDALYADLLVRLASARAVLAERRKREEREKARADAREQEPKDAAGS